MNLPFEIVSGSVSVLFQATTISFHAHIINMVIKQNAKN